jgi:hypothetical protein
VHVVSIVLQWKPFEQLKTFIDFRAFKNKSVDITGKREYARYKDLKTSYCNIFSYSEWWRYIGSVKPRQPQMEGANLSE